MVTLVFLTDRSPAIEQLIATFAGGLLSQVFTTAPDYDVWVWEDAPSALANMIISGKNRPAGLLNIIKIYTGA